MAQIDLNAILQQAQNLQKSFEESKEKLKQETATASVGGNMVTATVDGEKKLKEIKIAPELLSEGDVEALQDLIVSAVNSANEEIEKKINSGMAAFAGNALGGLGQNFNLNDAADMIGKLMGGGKK